MTQIPKNAKQGKIGRKVGYEMSCPTKGCPAHYWRVKEQLGKPERCGSCREEVLLEHIPNA